MNAASIAHVAGLIGEARRIQMLAALLDGNAHSASELAMVADVSPQTASAHLSKLLAGGMVVSQRRGRQRLFRLKDSDVAAAIEALGALARHSDTSSVPEMRFARTCYDHLAGVLAIGLRNQLLKRKTLRQRKTEFLTTPTGANLLNHLDIDVAALHGLRRSFAYKCLDWTERHHHIGGALGAALLSRFFETKWLVRIPGSRAVRVTRDGEYGFERTFGIQCAALRAQSSIHPD